MREAERIQYRNLPWRVVSINMYTVLRNPELRGVLRIPLAEFHGMTSRPSGKDSWFPSSRGDIVLFEGNTLMEVLDQNPDTVELKHRGGQQVSIPTAQYYTMNMINLTRGGTFGVTCTFGIDYRHQSISHTQVPKILRDAIRESLTHSDLFDFLKDIRVELKEANASSIDYWIFVTCDGRAAKSYNRIERIIQSSCIEACTKESLEIPYPHLSIVQKPS
jgi:small-conductance mechanosensitive channel